MLMSNYLKVNEIADKLPSSIDLFMMCGSFESRCKVISESIKSTKIRKTVLFQNLKYEDVCATNLATLKSIFQNYTLENLDSSSPIDIADTFVEVLADEVSDPDCRSVLIDITTFTRESLLILIKILFEFKSSRTKVYLAYSCASEMSKSWLSGDVVEIRSVLGYMGVIKPSRPLHLIIMLGFELDRCREIIDAYEPKYLSVGIGKKNESIQPEFQNRNYSFYKKLEAHYDPNYINKFDYSLVDFIKTKQSLDDQIKLYNDANVVIAPLNNKISTVGAAIVAIDNDEVQLCYSEVSHYNFDNYSKPSDDCLLFEVLDNE